MLGIQELINTMVHMGLSHVIVESNSVRNSLYDRKNAGSKEIVYMVQDIKSLAGFL